ncbi:hypothetical protein NYY95_18370, partial [Acinetobacter baumannii]|nr:hypothetical protein [Acinetobacter baumannii]
LASTREDLLRADSYRQNRERREMQGDSADLGEFLRRVQTRIVVRSCSAADVARAAQLTQRTNQFNLTTQRLDAAGIAARLADADSRVLC